MLRYSSRGYLPTNLRFPNVRNIFVVALREKPSHNKRKSLVVRNTSPKDSLRKSDDESRVDHLLRMDSERLRAEKAASRNLKLRSLKDLNESVAGMIRTSDINVNELHPVNKATDQSLLADIDSLSIKHEKISPPPLAVKIAPYGLATPIFNIPQSITDRLGLALRYLVSQKNQNWLLVCHQLQLAGGLAGVLPLDLKQFIQAIPPQHLRQIVPNLEKMIHDAGHDKTNKINVYFMRALVSLSSLNDQEIEILERYGEQIRQRAKSKELPREILELMIQAYGKNSNMDAINRTVDTMKRMGLQPSPAVFSNILTTCVYKSRNHKQAVQVFDTMKFLSQKTGPDSRAYQDIIVSYVNAGDIERALDLYTEMITNKVPLNQAILVALARGCTLRPNYMFKAWDFMFQIYSMGWKPTLESYEYMLYLLSKDGDISMSRALYLRLVKSNTSSTRAFAFLLMAYSKCEIGPIIEPALIEAHSRGRIFRNNLIADADFENEGLIPVPFLPLIHLVTKKQVLAELSALWAHALENHRDFITVETTTTYLNIAAENGNLADFIDRYNLHTFLDTEGLPKTRLMVIEPADSQDITPAQSQYDDKTITKSPALNQDSNAMRLKTPRVPLTYVVALKAASNFKNYKFAQNIWVERGKYRKTTAFNKLSIQEKDKLDFQFASAMISALTKMNLLDDALAILISTEYQFKWTWAELSCLNQAASEVGNTHICKCVSAIAKRAQLKFEGKIRKKDFRRYVMQRGF